MVSSPPGISEVDMAEDNRSGEDSMKAKVRWIKDGMNTVLGNPEIRKPGDVDEMTRVQARNHKSCGLVEIIPECEEARDKAVVDSIEDAREERLEALMMDVEGSDKEPNGDE